MLKEYRETYVHKYDSPFTAFIDENDYYDETTGDVESPIGWIGRAGRNIVQHDSQGFVSRFRFASETAAREAFSDLNAEYGDWMGDDD